ncbi:hypothetical protein [Catellatospora tritici]|uniref:hypothetical protein n=1 Tax=Catellatospora tritici TaxID=2851566 RepID=UPI001C2DB1F9|nr:hypothetical protein [Catellatospora tritici]MBV1855791.1 hypothetical protein [Catellatospora tritici]
MAVAMLLACAGYVIAVIAWAEVPTVGADNDWTAPLMRPSTAPLLYPAALVALLGLAAGAAMVVYAIPGPTLRARLIRLGVLALGASYGVMIVVYYTHEAAHLIFRLRWAGFGTVFGIFAAASWAALGCVPLALRARSPRWTAAACAAAPFLVGALTALAHMVAPQLQLSYGVLALNVMSGAAVGAGGLLLIWLGVQAVSGTVDAGLWFAGRVEPHRRWAEVLVAATATGAVVYFAAVAAGYYRPFSLVYSALVAMVSVGVLLGGRAVALTETQQQAFALGIVLLLFGPRLLVGAVSPPLVGLSVVFGVPAVLGGAALLGGLTWAALRTTRRAPRALRAAVFATACLLSSAGAVVLDAIVGERANVAVFDRVSAAMRDGLGLMRDGSRLGFKDHLDTGIILVGAVSVVLLTRRSTRQLGIAGLFVFAWMAPWLWDQATASLRPFWVVAVVLLAVLAAAARLRRFGAGVAPVMILAAIWTVSGVAWWLAYVPDLIPKSWAMFTVPLAFAGPVLLMFLVQAQPLNSGDDRDNRVMAAAGAGVACATFALFFVANGMWREDLPWSGLATIFLAMPIAVLTVASSDTRTLADERTEPGPATVVNTESAG